MTRNRNPPATKVLLTDRAISDLLEIESYSISKWGKSAASKYMGKFEKTFKLLELNPDLLHANEALGESLLFFRVEKHLLACVKIKPGVAVLTIVHANRDLDTILHELLPTLKEETILLLSRLPKK